MPKAAHIVDRIRRMPKSFRNQDYGALRKACLKNGELFEDQEFPANTKSLFFSKVDPSIEWMRPKELCKVPRLIVDGVTCDDLNPGDLGNSWFVTACASLAQEKKIWQKVIPEWKAQEWDDKNQYCGIFRFNFWRFGQWQEVVVDDRLPTRDGKLCFCHSNSRNEFWSALLEKAYAKMFGDYESIASGIAVDALVDFTGGVAERLELTRFDMDDKDTRARLFDKLAEASDNVALMVSRIDCTEEDKGATNADGLVSGLGYTLTCAKKVEVKKSLQGAVGAATLQLVRLFNPWTDKEWTGPWSPGSPEWRSISVMEWEKMGVKFRMEGEFWMCFDDFVKHFTHIDICHFVNTAFFSLKRTWSEAIFHAQWSVSGRNGGGDFQSATFLSNPQFLFDVTGESDRIMVSLEQHDVKGREALIGNKNTIGFHIMKVEENRKFRVHIPGQLCFTSDYDDHRSVFGTTKLRRGRYVVVPTAKAAGAVGAFMLRLYTAQASSAKELQYEGPEVGCPCQAPYKLVTTVRVHKCTDLEPPANHKGSFDPQVVIRCEGEKVTSDWVAASNNPEYDVYATFYRKKPDMNITIEVWNHNRLMNDHVAEGRTLAPEDEDGADSELPLYGRKQEAETLRPGKVHVFLRTSTDLTML